MVFLSLLTKEMRLRLRRERTIWILITYVLLMGSLGWLFLSNTNTNNQNGSGNGLSDIGVSLYALLSQIQLFLIIFITPSLTATAINGEKERQTYDMLLCSRLTAFSIVMGKLAAGLINALLLIAASLPLFSLVFFFGGISPNQIGSAFIVYLVTALWLGTLGLLCSSLCKRAAISTAIAYMFSLIWLFLPFLISIILLSTSQGYRFFRLYPNKSKLLFAWNPLIALNSTYPNNTSLSPFFFFLNFGYGAGYANASSTPYILGTWQLSYWLLYTLITLAVAICCSLLCMWAAKPLQHWHRRKRTHPWLIQGSVHSGSRSI